MYAPAMTPRADQHWGAYLNRWGQIEPQFKPLPMGDGFHTRDGLSFVYWDHQELSAETTDRPGGIVRRLTAHVNSTRTAMDLLYAIDIAPVKFSSAYAVGLADGRNRR